MGKGEYLKCPVHKSQFIQLICLSCSCNSLACPLCLDASHGMHQVISLKKFVSHELPKLYDHKPNPESLGKAMDMLAGVFRQHIDKLRKEIGHELNQLQLFFAERAERLKQELLFVCGEHSVKNLYENAEAAKSMLSNKKKIPDEPSLAHKLQQIESKMGSSINDACIEIRRIVYKLKNLHQQSSDLLLGSHLVSKFQFSQGHAHGSIGLKNNNLWAYNKDFDNVYHSCAVVPPLCPFHNEVTFEIRKSEHKCIWVGVADLSLLASTKYENSYKGDGAGYWIWQAGGDEAEVYAENSPNRPLAGWSFGVGDRITLRIEHNEDGTKELQILKNDDHQSKHRLQISSQVGYYYACVGLGDEQESVGILNKQ